MKNWKVKEGQRLDLNALPSKLRGVAQTAYAKSGSDKSEQHRVANARADISDYFGYISASRSISLAKIVHAFKTGRLISIAPDTVTNNKDAEEATA